MTVSAHRQADASDAGTAPGHGPENGPDNATRAPSGGRPPEGEPGGSGPGEIVFEARGLVKTYGHVTALDGCDFELRAGEVLAVIGDNGAGKSTLIKALSGALVPDRGELLIDGRPVRLHSPLDARRYGIETVYQDLAIAPALDIATNLYLGREIRRAGPAGRWLRLLDKRAMRRRAAEHMQQLQIGLRSMSNAVEDLSGGQRQGVAVARAAAFAQRLVIMDEPTAALGVRESGQVLDLIRRIRDRGLPVILISHNMPHVFEVSDRIHVQRLGRRVALIHPQDYRMAYVVAIMTGAMPGTEQAAPADREPAPEPPATRPPG
jgi:fructose transport system ATP-binding protein